MAPVHPHAERSGENLAEGYGCEVERLQDITEDGAEAEGAIDNRGLFTARRMNMIAYIQLENILLKSGTEPSRNLILTSTVGTQTRGSG